MVGAPLTTLALIIGCIIAPSLRDNVLSFLLVFIGALLYNVLYAAGSFVGGLLLAITWPGIMLSLGSELYYTTAPVALAISGVMFIFYILSSLAVLFGSAVPAVGAYLLGACVTCVCVCGALVSVL